MRPDPVQILEKSLQGERISPEEALHLYRYGDFLEIQKTARELRGRKVDPETASYTMFRVVNYTDRCVIQCSFCSFKVRDAEECTLLGPEDVVEKMREAVNRNADQLFLQGGVHPELGLDYFRGVLSAVREEFGPEMHIRALSPVEVLHLARKEGLEIRETLRRLKETGLDSLPGAGAEILTERMRKKLSPKKASVAEWVEVMETAHSLGIGGSANIVFGSEETREEVIEHLDVIRKLQDRSGGLRAFVVWTFQTRTLSFPVRVVPPHEYLTVLGIARIFLDNIDHLETSLLVQGQELGALALRGGADDISSVVIEENVLENRTFTTEKEAVDFLTDNGFRPRRRDFDYNYREPFSIKNIDRVSPG